MNPFFAIAGTDKKKPFYILPNDIPPGMNPPHLFPPAE